jgi:hypothetical protein
LGGGGGNEIKGKYMKEKEETGKISGKSKLKGKIIRQKEFTR